MPLVCYVFYYYKDLHYTPYWQNYGYFIFAIHFWKYWQLVRFRILIPIDSNVALCNLVKSYQHLKGTCGLNLQDSTSETLVAFCLTIRRHIPENSDLDRGLGGYRTEISSYSFQVSSENNKLLSKSLIGNTEGSKKMYTHLVEVIYGHNDKVEQKFNVRCVVWCFHKRWC
jgi:hypothetical protein